MVKKTFANGYNCCMRNGGVFAMKTCNINLNKIFKAPLFRALSFVAIFFIFLVGGTILSSSEIKAVDLKVDGSKDPGTKYVNWNGVDDGTVDATYSVTASSSVNRIYFEYGDTTCYLGYDTSSTKLNIIVTVGSSTGIKSCRNSKDSTSTESYMYVWLYFRRGTVETESYTLKLDSTNWFDNQPSLTLSISGSAASAVIDQGPNAYWVNQGTGNAYYASDLSNAYIGSSSMGFDFIMIHRTYTGTPTAILYDGTDVRYSKSLGSFTCTRDDRYRPSGYASAYYCSLTISSISEGSKYWQIRAWYKNGSRGNRDDYWNTGSFVIDTTYPSASTYALQGASALVPLFTNSQTVQASFNVTDTNLLAVGLAEDGTIIKEQSTAMSNVSVNMLSATEGYHNLQFIACDKAENCIVTDVIKVYLDSTLPVIGKFTSSSGTTGDDGEKYVTGNISGNASYYDDQFIIPLVTITNICTLSGDVYGDLLVFTPTFSCSVATLSVSFTTKKTVSLTVYDAAGNYTSKSYSFYYIDETRKISISGFSVSGYGSLVDNWIGASGTTGGAIIPKYTITNSSYLSTITPMQLYDSSAGVYFTKATRITSGSSVTLEDGYGYSTTTSTWYSKHSDATTGTFQVTFKNKYGQTTTATVTVNFDLTAPTISAFSAADNDSSNNDITPLSGYTNSQTIKHSLTASDTNIYKYKVLDGSTTIYSLSTTSPNGVSDSLANTTAGTHTLYAYVYDKAGNSKSKSYSLVYDVTDPTISSFTVSDNNSDDNCITPTAGYTNSQSVLFSASTSDTNIWKYKILDGSSTIYSLSTTSPNGKTGSLANTTAGAHTIYLYVYDKAGNGVYTSYSIIYDETAPSITSFSAADNDASNNAITASAGYTNSTTIKYSLSYTETNVSKFKIWDGSTVIYDSATSPNGVSDSLANSTTGNHALKICIYDKAGNCAEASYNIIYWTGNGSIATFTAADNDSSNDYITPLSGYTNSQAIKYTTSITGSYLWKYKVLDGTNTIYSLSTTNPNGVADSLYDKTNGNHVLTLYVYDKAGNSFSKQYTIVYDDINPALTDTFKVTGNTCAVSGYTNQTSITYSGISASDANPYKYQVMDGSVVINALSDSAPTSGTLASTTNGTHGLKVYLIDKAGNAGYDSYDIVLDTVAPTFTGFDVIGTAGNKGGLTPSAGYTATTSVTFTLTGIGDTTSGVYWYRVMDGSTNMYAKGTTKQTSGTLASTTNGTHTIKYTIWDKACNSKEITDTIILDTVRPVVNVTTDSTTKTTVINFSDAYLKTNAKIGSNYAYYMSESGSVTLSSVTTIAAKGTTANGNDVPMYVSGQSYYLYIMTKEITRDHAGNVPAPSSPISIYGTALVDGYSGYTYKVAMNVNTSDYGDSSVPIDPNKLASDSASKADEYDIDVVLKDRILMITVQKEKFSGAVSITLTKLNEVLATAGYKILGVGNSTSYAFTKSAIYHDVLISKSDHTQNEIIDLIFVVEAPTK